MADLPEILDIATAAKHTPFSQHSLYRIAKKPDGPFHKVNGRWVTTREELLDWVKQAPKQKAAPVADPMPTVARDTDTVEDLLTTIQERRRAA